MSMQPYDIGGVFDSPLLQVDSHPVTAVHMTAVTEPEEDWLTGPACVLDADGNVDPSCEACQ